MKTFSFAATYHYEDTGEVEARSYDEARQMVEENLAYVVTEAGFADSWGWVDINLNLESDDEEDDEDA